MSCTNDPIEDQPANEAISLPGWLSPQSEAVLFDTEKEEYLRILSLIARRLGLVTKSGTDFMQKPGLGAYRYIQIGFHENG